MLLVVSASFMIFRWRCVAQTERPITRLLYMLARYTDLMSEDDSVVDQFLALTFDDPITDAYKRAALRRYSRFNERFLPPTAHHNLLVLLDPLGEALSFFLEARWISDSYNTKERALQQSMEHEAQLAKTDTDSESPENERALLTAQSRILRAQRNFDRAKREREMLDFRKDTPPFRYRTFIDALWEARVDWDEFTLMDEPNHGCKKVSDRVESARKSRM